MQGPGAGRVRGDCGPSANSGWSCESARRRNTLKWMLLCLDDSNLQQVARQSRRRNRQLPARTGPIGVHVVADVDAVCAPRIEVAHDQVGGLGGHTRAVDRDVKNRVIPESLIDERIPV